jgi:uncharacterized membrane protein YdjX (TVP38/TMEM64 family)
LALVIGGWPSDWGRLLAAHRSELQAFLDRWPLVGFAVYVVAFAVLTGACLPVALMLTLAGGALLGPLLGGAGTALGATMGALLTYMAARSALGGWVSRRLRSARLEDVVLEARKRPFPLLLAARLTPLFPFAPLNVAAGVASLPIRPFAVATFLGAIPTSFIYSHLGAGLDHSITLNGGDLRAAAMTPQILLPLAALALLSLTPLAIERLKGSRAGQG